MKSLEQSRSGAEVGVVVVHLELWSWQWLGECICRKQPSIHFDRGYGAVRDALFGIVLVQSKMFVLFREFWQSG